MLKLENGMLVSVAGEVSSSVLEEVAIIATGTEGRIIFDFIGVKAGKKGEELAEVELESHLSYDWIVTHIIRAIHGEPAEIYDFKAGYEAQVVVDQLRKGTTNLAVVNFCG